LNNKKGVLRQKLVLRKVEGCLSLNGRKAGIYDIPRPMSFAKIAIICPACKKPTRVGFKLSGEEKVRVCKKCAREIDKGKSNRT